MPFTAPGDRVVAEVPGGEGPAHGALVELLEPGRARVEAPCAHFGPAPAARCGGCEWLHVAYEAQLAAKERAFQETLRRIGRLEPGSYRAPPIVPSPSPWRYRARAKLHLDRAAGKLAFFRRRSHEPVPLQTCHLLEPGLDALREAAGPALAASRLDPREVALEWSASAGPRGGLPPPRGADLGRPHPGRGAPRRAALAGGPGAGRGGRAALAPGRPRAPPGAPPGAPGAGLQRSRPDVFLQANRGANARLVEVALDLLAPEGEHVLELHCGAGNFTAPLAARARSVHAVEVQGPALDLARADASQAPGPARVRFFAGDALALARAFARERGPEAPRFGAALLDPPREGARGAAAALRALGVPRFVYVSCDPATLARDLRAAVEAGYRVAAAQAVDLFPQTHHVEGVALVTLGEGSAR